MRIISKFKDYYDSAQMYGHDDYCTYYRKEEEFQDDTLDKLISRMPDGFYRFIKLTPYIVGFCGKLYPIWNMGGRYEMKREYQYDRRYEYIPVHSTEDIIKATRLYPDHKKIIKKFREPIPRWNQTPNYSTVEECFKYYINKVLNYDASELFIKYKTPIFVVSYNTNERKSYLKTNAQLKNLGFYKHVDTFQTYQEIEMFISGVLGSNEPDMIDISDEHMRDAKGFDDMSFKTHKPGKKLNRKNNKKVKHGRKDHLVR